MLKRTSTPAGFLGGVVLALGLLTLGAAQGAPLGLLQQYPLPAALREPRDITLGPDGNLWFPGWSEGSNAERAYIGRITPRGRITRFRVSPGSFPSDITVGPDGALWFTEPSAAQIGRITTAGEVTELRPPGFPEVALSPNGITAGPDGNLWITDPNGATEFRPHRIWKVTPQGEFTPFEIPTTLAIPRGITTGPDGALWFTEFGAGKIGRITPEGVITEFDTVQNPVQIVAGPDGALWFTFSGDGGGVGRITTDGTITLFPTPQPTVPFDLTVGPDGALWFTEFFGERLFRITVDGEISLVRRIPHSGAWGISRGPGKTLWVTLPGTTPRFRDSIGVLRLGARPLPRERHRR